MKKASIFFSFALVGLMVCFFVEISKAEDNAVKVKAAMGTLLEKLSETGVPSLKGEDLFFGKVKMNDNYEIVDAVAKKHGCTATIFMKNGTDFIRISTNVTIDGIRLIGTPLATTSPAFALVQKGKTYYGPAEILGTKYLTAYEPLKDASGEIVAVAYVGYKL